MKPGETVQMYGFSTGHALFLSMRQRTLELPAGQLGAYKDFIAGYPVQIVDGDREARRCITRIGKKIVIVHFGLGRGT